MRRKPEKIEENKFVTMCNRAEYEAVKLSTQGMYGKRGFNDRCVFAFPGVVALFEFKRIGEEARKLQKARHRKFKKLRIPTYVVYTAKEAWKILQKRIRLAKRIERVYEAFRDEETWSIFHAKQEKKGVRTKKLSARIH